MVALTETVVIVTGGSTGSGREFARALAARGYAVVVVYLDDQRGAEAAVDEIVSANGTAIAVRADITDELDVLRLFSETVAAFGRVDLIVHAEPRPDRIIDHQAAQHLRDGGAIVDVGTRDEMAAPLVDELCARGITGWARLRCPADGQGVAGDPWIRRSSGQNPTGPGDSLEAMKITLLQPAGLVANPAFSHVAIVPPGATTIYVGGQNGVDATGSVVSSDIAEQSRRAIDNTVVALEAAGASLADVIQWTVLIAEEADLGAAYGAIAPRLVNTEAPPLVTAALVAGLGVRGALIEVSAIAARLPG